MFKVGKYYRAILHAGHDLPKGSIHKCIGRRGNMTDMVRVSGCMYNWGIFHISAYSYYKYEELSDEEQILYRMDEEQ